MEQIPQFHVLMIEPDANYQMSHSCGHNEPLKTHYNRFFSCAIAIYFNSFFFEHPVGLFQLRWTLNIDSY